VGGLLTMTTEAKHTPGPWAVHPSKARVDAFVGGAPLPVCELLWPTDQRSEAETEANARLIAAAPELLAACKAMLVLLIPKFEHEPMKYFSEIQQIEAALSKAEGR
jgi:hypothetical protein